MSRLIILGIDAMDSALLARFESGLPNFSRLKAANPGVRLSSVYPPDTPSAWASIYTGLNPANHGIIYFVDPLDKVSIFAGQDLSGEAVRGRTFWDIAGSHGKRVCVLLPFLGYPPWDVNGIMVGRSTNRYNKGGWLQTAPAGLVPELDLKLLNPTFSNPQKKLMPKYIEAYRRLVRAEADFAVKMLAREPWDMFFLYSSALDWVGHNLWSYLDETDPAYPGANRFQDIYAEFYRLYDDMLGRLLAAAGDDVSVMVVSDHGFGQRPSRLLNVNEMLRRSGLLAPRLRKGQRNSSVYWTERFKRLAVSVVNRTGAGPGTVWLVHHLPGLRRRFTVPQFIDWENTAAYVSDLSGIKAYSYGGVIIARDRLRNRDYEKTRSEIIEGLMSCREPANGEPIVKLARRREELYSGPYLSKYPDIVFQLRDDCGTGWSVNEELTGVSPTHNIQPGTHRIDGAVLLFSDVHGARVNRRDLTLMDIAPTVLSLQGIEPPFPMDGASFLPPTQGNPAG